MATTPDITADDIRGIVAYIPTPVRKDIEIDRNVQNAVDLEEAARAADVVVRDGATAICLNGTFGELPSLTWEEIRDFTAAVVDSVAGRVPVFAGATTLNTRDTLFRARAFRDIGATGLNLGRGMLSEMGDPNIVRYYQDVAVELPDMAIFLYDDVQAFKRPLSTAVYRELAQVPQIVACKYRTTLLLGTLLENTYDKDLEAVDGRIKLLTHELDWPLVHRFWGNDAIWSSAFSYVPGAIVALRDAIFSGDTATQAGDPEGPVMGIGEDGAGRRPDRLARAEDPVAQGAHRRRWLHRRRSGAAALHVHDRRPRGGRRRVRAARPRAAGQVPARDRRPSRSEPPVER